MTLLLRAARRTGIAALVAFAPLTAAQAQTTPAPNTQTPTTVPGLDDYSLPAQPERPTPIPTPEPKIAPLPRPSPSATPVPIPSPVPRQTPVAVTPPPARPTIRPTPAATPVARPSGAAATPTIAAPAPIPSPAASASLVPAPTPAPSPTAIPAETPPAPAQRSGDGMWWVLGVALAAVLAGFALYRRRNRAADDGTPVAPSQPIAPEPPLPAPPPAPAPIVAAPRAQVEIALEVKRAGTNLLSAAVEYRVILRNAGEVDARGIALDMRLFGVAPGLEAALDSLFAAPLGQPVVARFDLAAGTTAALEGTAMLPRATMPPLPLQGAGEGRVLFVPVMTVNLHYGWEGGTGQSAASFVVGVDRGADAKLGPFRLDGAPRMHDRVRLMPFTVSRTR